MKRMHSKAGGKRHARIVFWCLVTVVLGSLVLPLSGYLYVAVTDNQAVAAERGDENVNPIANFWRAVRRGEEGYTAASGPYTTNDYIMSSGEIWRDARNGYVGWGTAGVMLGVLLLILLFYAIKGSKKVEGGNTGPTMARWSGGERLLHWYTAILFILLAITGFSLLFGRAVLIPLFGLEGFSAFASVAKLAHNFLGPLFLVGVVLEVITWMRFNLFRSYDWDWLKKMGGMFSQSEHPPAGRTNAGEKLWFWFIATFGLIGVGFSGLVLDFPIFGQSRETMQLANIIHASLAGLWTAIAFGHIYLGTIGLEGTWSGMSRGWVTEKWMKQHHNLWYEKVKSGETSPTGGEAASTPAPRPGPDTAHS